MSNVMAYIDQHKDEHLKEMIECLKIPSVSADSSKEPEIRRCGQWCADKLKAIGFENVALKETGGFPAVYGEWLHAGKGKPTIMVYGHYDVQPVEPLDKWNTPPFEPTIKGDFIYGRGTSDDKSQLLTHVFALEAIMKTEGKFPVNVKVFLEGEEEGGAGGTAKFVEDNTGLLACDAVVLSDTSWPSTDLPTMIYALRGIAYFQVELKGPNRDLHSGMYGGKVQNTLNAMARMIAKLHDDDGRIAIPGIYDDVLPLTDAERKEFAKVAEKDEQLMKDLGVSGLWGEKGFTSTERNWARPALDVNGVWGGYAGEGGKTVIASEAGFKISMRLVANQTVEGVRRKLTDYIKRITPPGITSEVKFLHGGDPVMVPTDNRFIACAKKAVKESFGKEPVLVREGASVPITATFLKALKAPSVFMGFGLNDDNIHSPNEKFRLSHFYNGIKASARFFEEAGKL